MWGKLQILGLGTAIKILLTPEEELRESTGFLNRQEVIALVNTLNQFTKSVSFAAHASELEFTAKLNDFRMKGLFSFCIISVVTLFFYVRHKLRRA